MRNEVLLASAPLPIFYENFVRNVLFLRNFRKKMYTFNEIFRKMYTFIQNFQKKGNSFFQIFEKNVLLKKG